MSTKRKAIIEGGKSLLRKFGKKAAAGVLGVGGALLNTQKAYGGQPTVKDEKKRQALMQDYYDTLVGVTTTSLYGAHSQYNVIPHWKTLG